MGKKAGRKKNFHLVPFAVKKVKKVGLLRSGYAAGLPGGCFAISASSAILQGRSSRTQWHFVPRDADFALFKCTIMLYYL